MRLLGIGIVIGAFISDAFLHRKVLPRGLGGTSRETADQAESGTEGAARRDDSHGGLRLMMRFPWDKRLDAVLSLPRLEMMPQREFDVKLQFFDASSTLRGRPVVIRCVIPRIVISVLVRGRRCSPAEEGKVSDRIVGATTCKCCDQSEGYGCLKSRKNVVLV